ncbi:MAG: DNA double-strand break repair nuclease NurA [Chloroflexi bacterium]|nr:DNA double-strand break repair nuclease NurA [Chloroflexota bacterium]
MTLDLGAVSRQIRTMTVELRDTESEFQARVARAREILNRWAERHHELRNLVTDYASTLRGAAALAALPTERLNVRYAAPTPPTDVTVLASDSSTIPPDRHTGALYYLINVGSTALHYGSAPGAVLDSRPTLYYRETDLFIQGEEPVPVQGSRLEAKSILSEVEELVNLAQATPSDQPAVALLDFPLILWILEENKRFVQRHFLEPFLEYLDIMRDRDVPIAGYVSRPGYAEVAGLLRVALCQEPERQCRACLRRGQDAPCDEIARVTDRDIFSTLEPGERTGLFMSRSEILKEYPAPIRFFYLKVGREVARVEVPAWVAQDRDLLDLVHAVVYDQAQKGTGYPYALSRAHEQAVVGYADRERFAELVKAALLRQGLEVRISEKSRSKLRRAI